MITNIYVDGFNLYYGCLKRTPYRWLDIRALVQRRLPQNAVHWLRYFTARIIPRDKDPEQALRQATYIRALESQPSVSVHYGQYLKSIVRMPLAGVAGTGGALVEVVKTEEKGTDVSLACHILRDAYRKECEAMVVITNDSDLFEPIYLARRDFGIRVVLLHPCKPPRKPSYRLMRTGAKSIIIQEEDLAACQFPAELSDSRGSFCKPAAW